MHRAADMSPSRELSPVPAERAGSGALRREAAVVALAFVGGYAAAVLGYALVLRPSGVVFLWPPSGVVLAALLLLPGRDWPWVLAGTLASNIAVDAGHGAAASVAVAGAAVNALEQLLAATVVRRFVGTRLRLESLRELGVFIIGAVVVCNSVTSLLGALVLGGHSTMPFARAWLWWWTGDGMGMLIVVPAVVTSVRALQGRTLRARQWAEAAVLAVVTATVTYALIRATPGSASAFEGFAILAYPLVIIAGIRLGPWGAACGALAMTVAVSMLAGTGELFARLGNPTHFVLEVHVFLALAAVGAYIPAAVIAEQRATADALRASDARFRQIAENINEAFFLVDVASWKAVYVSPSWSTIWGRPIEAAYDPNLWFEAIHPDDRDAMSEARRTTAAGAPTSTEFRIHRPNGAIRRLRGRTFPIRDASGAVVRIVGLAEDVTDLRNTEERFSQAQKMEAVGRLAGGIAHDFNNLLTVIFAESDFLAASELSGQDRDSVAEIRRAAERASGLTRQLLAFSRRQLAAPRVYDLNDIVRETSRMLDRLIGEDIELEMRLGAGQLCVLADRSQVEQVVANLAVNARDAMPGGGTLRIETAAVTTPEPMAFESGAATDSPAPLGWVALSVRDTGTGMTQDVMTRVFEPFFTTKGMGRGTGLGLSSSHGIIQQAGGRIGITSAPDAGTTMRILLPRVPATAAEDISHTAAVPRGTERVLLVEDETAVRRATARSLRALGYQVLEAPHATEALRMLASVPEAVDLLLTDIVMPGMSGHELAFRVREVMPAVRTLYVSGYAADHLPRIPVDEPHTAFVAKPFTADALAKRVREVLDEA